MMSASPGAFYCCIAVYADNPRGSMITAAFLTFVAAAVLGNLGSQNPHYAGLIVCAGWFFACRALPERGWKWLLTIVLWLSVAVAALAVAQVALWMPRARGAFVSPNFLGAYAVLMVFLAVASACGVEGFRIAPQQVGGDCKTAARWRSICLAAANLISLALSQSRGALLALGAGLAVLIVFLPGLKKLSGLTIRLSGLTMVLVFAIACALLIRSGNEESRMGMWLVGLQGGLQRPVTGWGIGGLMVSGLNRFYSIPIEWFTNAGILGVMAGTWLLAAATWVARGQPALLAFLAAWFVQGLFLDGTPATNMLLVTVLAWLARSEHRHVADDAGRVDDDHPALDGRVRAGRAER